MTSAAFTRRSVLKGMSAVSAALATPAVFAAEPRPAALPFSDYRRYDGLGLAELVRTGSISAEELLDAAIDRIEAVNPTVNAVVERLYDLARAAIRAGLPAGPFTGVPFLLKDLDLAVKGSVTTNGSRFFLGNRADHDGLLTTRYRQAGLVILGRTATPELGLTGTTESLAHGLTRNPWNLNRIAGGSSGGAAAAIAAEMVPMAHASDGAGSIRTPASCCGLFGLKPSRARVPSGSEPSEGWNGLSTAHAITRSVRDSAALLDAVSAPDVGAPYWAPPSARPFLAEVGAAPGQLRIALMTRPLSGSPVDTQCLAAVRDTAKLCADLGHVVEEATPPIDHQALNDGILTTLVVTTAKTLKAREAVLGRAVTQADVEKVTWILREMGLKTDGIAYATARDNFNAAGRAMAGFMTRYDLILTPTLAEPPVELGLLGLSPEDYDRYLAAIVRFGPFTALYNATGQPAMSVPLHWSPDGLPIGSMFAARFGDEATLFRLAAQLEEARPWHQKRPSLRL